VRWSRILGLTPGELSWLVCGVALLAYELVAAANGRDGLDVLTRAMRANMPRWTAVPAGLGVLMGHLTGPVWPAFRFAWAIPFVALGCCLARDLLIRGRVPDEAVLPIFVGFYLLGILWVGRP
jgi:hypothetical protein